MITHMMSLGKLPTCARCGDPILPGECIEIPVWATAVRQLDKSFVAIDLTMGDVSHGACDDRMAEKSE